ncbi:hypothetical protein LNP74_33605 [Klebsiella pneumoniae subsp. pneumoniae]|nr:hypothetical protein [Klebsiella pneumoniae subsp. pneumoniae]
MIASEVSDLPLPDSPAMHRVFSRPERKADVIHHPLCTKLDRQALDREQRRRK